jgi:hypothetical protein
MITDHRMRRGTSILGFFLALMAAPGLGASEVLAQSEASEQFEQYYIKGSGSIFFNYQYISVDEFDIGPTRVPTGEVRTQSFYVQVDYAVADRFRLKAGVPFIKKKASGSTVHDPLALVPPRPEVPFIDDGKYRSNFQDFFIGVEYLWINKPVTLEPFFSFSIPMDDYDFFGNSAIGPRLWKAEFGLELTHLMPFSDWYYTAGVGYVISEKALDVNVNHFRIHAEVGYFLAPDFSINVFGTYKKGNGDSALQFPPPARTTELWYQHDRTTRHNYANAGIGADWFVSHDYQISASALQTIWADSAHWVDFAINFGVTRYF